MNLNSKAPNKRKQSDLGELSPFLQEAAKIPPSHPTRCFGRYIALSLIVFLLSALSFNQWIVEQFLHVSVVS